MMTSPIRAAFNRAVLAMTVLLTAGASWAEQARSEYADLAPEVRTALEKGQVVLLETVAGENDLLTRVVAVIPAAPAQVVEEIRDYDRIPRMVPGVRSVDVERSGGTEEGRDRYMVDVKPHPFLPRMELASELAFEVEEDGDAAVDVQLVSSTYERIEDQRAEWRLLKLNEASTLAIYQRHETFRSLPFRKRVLARLADGCQELVTDVREACASRAATVACVSPAGGVALLTASPSGL